MVVASGGGVVQWVLANSGDIPWPSATTLRLIGGPVLLRPAVDIPALQPGQTVIVDLDVQVPEEPTSIFYTLVGPDCQPFGEILTLNVVPKRQALEQEPACALLGSLAGDMNSGPSEIEAYQGEMKTVEWALANVGSVAWPEDVVATLVHSTPGLEQPPGVVTIPCIQPGMTVHVGIQILMPARAGLFKAIWKVESPTHPDFGEILQAEFNVSDIPFMEWMATGSASRGEMMETAESATDRVKAASMGEPRSSKTDASGLGGGRLQARMAKLFSVKIFNRFTHLAAATIDEEDGLLMSETEPQLPEGTKPQEEPQLRMTLQQEKGKSKQQRRKEMEEACNRMWWEQWSQLKEHLTPQPREQLSTELVDGPHLHPKPQPQPQCDAEHQSAGPHPPPVPSPPQEAEEGGDEEMKSPHAPQDEVGIGSCLEVGDTVEVRHGDDEDWEQGTVASIDPLTILAGDNMMAFEYQHVRPVRFNIGAKVEVRNSSKQSWQPASVASATPLTVFVGDSAMAFEYRQVRHKGAADHRETSPSVRSWHVFMALLALLISTLLGTNMVGLPQPPSASGGIHLHDKSWLSNAAGGLAGDIVEDQAGHQEHAAVVQRMRELGHLRLSTSDCEDAERWFARATSQLERDAANRSLEVAFNRTQLENLDHAALLGDHGFALVCAGRYADGIAILKSALQHAALPASQPHLLNALGVALFQQREYDAAEEAFLAAVRANPMNPLQWSNVASASILVGDRTTAQNALEQALRLVTHLGQASRGYYEQVISNNIHVLQGHVAEAWPTVEIFYCAPKQVSALASAKSPQELQQTFQEAVAESAEGPVDVPVLADAREAVMALHPEPVVCL